MDYAMEYALMCDIYDEMGGSYRLTPANEGFFGKIGDALKKAWDWIVRKFTDLIKWITGAKKRELQEKQMRDKQERDAQRERAAFRHKAEALERELNMKFDKYYECVRSTCQSLINQSYVIVRLIKSYKKKGVKPDSNWSDKMMNLRANLRTMDDYFNAFNEVRDKICEWYDGDVAVFKMLNANNLQQLENEIQNLGMFINKEIDPVMGDIDAYIPNDDNNEFAKSDRELAKSVTNTYINAVNLMTKHFGVIYKGDLVIYDDID